MSSSSSGIAVSVSKSSRSWSPGPPSRAGTCPQLCRALSMMPAKSHSARAGRLCHGCPPSQESDLDFVLPPGTKGFRRQMLPVSAGGDVCRALKRSSDGWMRPPVRRPHKWAVVNKYRVASILRFHFCNSTGYDRMPSVQHLRELPLQWRRPHTRPGTLCVRGQQR